MLHACLVSTLLYFSTLSGAFYMFSGTNLLTSCNSARCLFSAVYGFRQFSKEIFLELDGTKEKVNYFPRGTRSPEESRRGRPEGPDPPQARVGPTPRLARVWHPWLPPRSPPSPIKSPRCRNPEYPIKYPRNRL